MKCEEGIFSSSIQLYLFVVMVLRQISQQLFLQLPFLVILLLQSTSAGAYPRLSPSWLYALALFCSFAVVALPNNRDSANHVLVGLKENKHDSATPFAPQGFFRQQDILAVDVSKNTTSSQRTPSHDNRLHSSKFLTNLTFMVRKKKKKKEFLARNNTVTCFVVPVHTFEQ